MASVPELQSMQVPEYGEPQPEIHFCPKCGQPVRNVPRAELKSKPYVRRDGTVSPYTRTYECLSALCGERFQIVPQYGG